MSGYKPGIICAVQMNWSADIYRTKETFEDKIKSIMDRIEAGIGNSNPEKLIVFPEDVGTPLVLAGAPDRVFRADSLKSAISRLTAYHIAKVLICRMRYKVGWIRALALARAKTAGRIYLDVFSSMAKKYRAYIIAGSILLPGINFDESSENVVPDIVYNISDGRIYNMSFLFGPDGGIIGYQKKVYLVPGLEDAEGFDICNGPLNDLQVFNTPFGKVGIAVCLDSFKQDVLDELIDKGADILIQPSANCKPWTREEQAGWMESAWQAIYSRKELIYAVNPMMTGCLFDLCFEGQSSILYRGAQAGCNIAMTGYSELGPSPYFIKVAGTHNGEELLTAEITDHNQ